jgi:hypothetical protein
VPWIKLLPLLLTLVAALLQFGLDQWWHDKRTIWNRRIRAILVVMMVAGTLSAGYVVYRDQQYDEEREKDAKAAEASLHQQLDTLSSKLDPFLALAKSRFPDAAEDKALQRLLDELERRTQSLEQNAPRTLTPEERLQLVELLKQPCASERKLEIIVGFDPEPQGFANALQRAFQESAWETNLTVQIGMSVPPGLYLITEHDQATFDQTCGLSMLLAFSQVGLSIKGSGFNWREQH